MKKYNYNNPIPLKIIEEQAKQFIHLPCLILEPHSDEAVKPLTFLIEITEKHGKNSFYIREHQREVKPLLVVAHTPSGNVLGAKNYTSYKVMDIYSQAGNGEYLIQSRGNQHDLLLVVLAFWKYTCKVYNKASFKDFIDVPNLMYRIQEYAPFRHKITYHTSECRIYERHEPDIECCVNKLKENEDWLRPHQKTFLESNPEYSLMEFIDGLEYLFTIYTHESEFIAFTSKSNNMECIITFINSINYFSCCYILLGNEIKEFSFQLWIDDKALSFIDILECRARFMNDQDSEYSIKAFLDSEGSDEYLQTQLLIKY